MKKYIISLFLSLLCIFTPLAILSGNPHEIDEHNDIGDSSSTSHVSYEVNGKDSTTIRPELLDSPSRGAEITILNNPSPVKNRNYFSYNGRHDVIIDDQLISVLDSLFGGDQEYKEAMLANTNTLIRLQKDSIAREHRQRMLEAKAYRAFPWMCIVSFVLIIFLSIGRETRFKVLFQTILSLIFVATLYGTIYHYLPVAGL